MKQSLFFYPSVYSPSILLISSLISFQLDQQVNINYIVDQVKMSASVLIATVIRRLCVADSKFEYLRKAPAPYVTVI